MFLQDLSSLMSYYFSNVFDDQHEPFKFSRKIKSDAK